MFAQVILPLAVEGTFTYSVPESLVERISPGCRVLVSFGKKRIYSAIVHSLGTNSPEGFTPKSIIDLLDETILITKQQLQLWDWISSYYMCAPGEVMRAAIPSGLRPESESRVRINTGYLEGGELDRHELLLFEVVKEQGEVTLGDLDMAGVAKNPLAILKRLVEKGAVEINEFVRPVIHRKIVSYIQLGSEYGSEDSLHQLLDQLNRAHKQKELVECFLELAYSDKLVKVGTVDPAPQVLKRELLRQSGGSGALTALIKKGYLEQVDKEELGRSGSQDANT
ncbi:MAG: hypothetical protein KAS29_08570, partial [Bacteroidales bacterium]|nr:hypothetical protein [Bacteroidales bacterium]